ncbi:MAG: decaprenyl-phosphate phosphoribosyltransferase [Ignavibacteriaceae bacterium]
MIAEYLKLFRVNQWIKNSFVFVPLVFSQNLFNKTLFFPTLYGFIIFCLTSSVVYIINDIIDAGEDRQHPVKKNRPVASGKISVRSALISALFPSAFVIITVFSYPLLFGLSVLTFFLLNVLYSFFLKKIVILDVFSIAAGFALRVLAGAFVIDVTISSWLILTTMFISLFLGVMKRHSEISLTTRDVSGATRKVLSQYSLTFTDQMATVASAGVIICYALYTVSERTVEVFHTENLIYTTPFVVFGIFRYMYLVYMNDEGENTSKILFTDLPMILTVLLYLIVTILIIY